MGMIGKVCLPLFLVCFVVMLGTFVIGVGTWEAKWFVISGALLIPSYLLCCGAACLAER